MGAEMEMEVEAERQDVLRSPESSLGRSKPADPACTAALILLVSADLYHVEELPSTLPSV